MPAFLLLAAQITRGLAFSGYSWLEGKAARIKEVFISPVLKKKLLKKLDTLFDAVV